MRMRLTFRDFVYLAIGAAVALGLGFAWAVLSRGSSEDGVFTVREAAWRDSNMSSSILPDAYWVPGDTASPLAAQAAQKSDGGLVACTLPINAELAPILTGRSGDIMLVRPGSGDERRLAMAVLTRRPVVWSEPNWRLAEIHEKDLCPDGRILVVPTLISGIKSNAAY